jgi:hypothetical protein
LFSGTNRAGLDWGNEITKEDFIGEYGLYSFDLPPDKCYGDHFNLLKKGNLRIKLSFREPVANVLSLYININVLSLYININVLSLYININVLSLYIYTIICWKLLKRVMSFLITQFKSLSTQAIFKELKKDVYC